MKVDSTCLLYRTYFFLNFKDEDAPLKLLESRSFNVSDLNQSNLDA